MRYRWFLVATVICGLAGPALAAGGPQMPANIQAIMNRLKQGTPPTPAEQKALEDWGKSFSASLSGAGGASPSAQQSSSGPSFQVGTREDQDPCKKKGSAVGFGVTPSRDAFVAMAKDAARNYRAHLLPAGQSSLDGVLPRANGSDISTMLVVHASGSAAVVSAAYEVEKNPDDALAANNLGVILRGMHDYARAAVALQYAKSKSPTSPVIASNLGWLAMGQGDQKTAAKFFNAAASKDNKLSPVLLGQGLVQLCGGHAAAALPLFRASVVNGFSDLAEAGIDSAEADIQSSSNPNADSGSADSYGQNSAGDMPNWQDPPFSGDAAAFATYHDKVIKYLDYWNQQAADAAKQATQVGLQVKGAGTTGSNGKLVFQRGYKKESFVLGDIRNILSRDTSPVVEKWASDVADRALHQDGCHTCAGASELPSCAWRARASAINGGVAAEEAGDWTKLRKSFADLYGFSRQWIQEIHDPAAQQVETAALQQWVTMTAAPFSQVIENWQAEVMLDYNAGQCSTPTVAAQKLTLKPYKIDPTKCNSGGMQLNFGFANLNADCDKMTLTMGEGLVGAAEWKFAPDYTKGADGVLRPTGADWSNDQVTIFVGAGGGVNGPLAPNGAVGGFVTVQNGEVIDAGGQAQVGISPGAGDGTGTIQAGATGRVGMMSGPDVSTSAGVRIGMPCGVSC